MKIYISHSTKYNFIDKLYNPIKKSSLYKNNIFFFPHDNNDIINTKDIIKTFDLIIADISFPSVGQGIELGWADYTNTPILCIYKKGKEISSSLKFITNLFIEYNDEKDMIKKLEEYIAKKNLK